MFNTMLQRVDAGGMPRHSHVAPYAAIILEGDYAETGDGGHYHVRDGDILIHGGFSAHFNEIIGRTRVLNLLLPGFTGPSFRARSSDLDTVVQHARTDAVEAAHILIAGLEAAETGEPREVDVLAAMLSAEAPVEIGTWASRHSLDRSTVFRRFRQAYGVSPTRYRIEARARRAWRRLVTEPFPIADIAFAEGYADQAHMTRNVVAVTGRTPADWRRGCIIHSRPLSEGRTLKRG